MDNKTFLIYWNENKNSEIIHNDYKGYKEEAIELGIKPLTFKQWYKESFNCERHREPESLLP